MNGSACLTKRQHIIDWNNIIGIQIYRRDISKIQFLNIFQCQSTIATSHAIPYLVATVSTGNGVICIAAMQGDQIDTAATINERIALTGFNHIMALIAINAI